MSFLGKKYKFLSQTEVGRKDKVLNEIPHLGRLIAASVETLSSLCLKKLCTLR